MNLTKEAKVLYTENYKTHKEMKEDTVNGKIFMWSWIGRHAIIKMSISPKVIYRFNVISIKIPKAFFAEKSILKFRRNLKLTNSQNILKKNKVGSENFRNFGRQVENKFLVKQSFACLLSIHKDIIHTRAHSINSQNWTYRFLLSLKLK